MKMNGNLLNEMPMTDNWESWHAILRIPNSKQEKFDEVIKKRESIRLKFTENARRGILNFADEQLGFAIKDLPCIVELCKVVSQADVLKVNNVSHILLCSETSDVPPMKPEEVEIESEIEALKEERIKNNKYFHGLTPPMKNVTKHRFRRTKNSRFIDAPHIDLQLRGIFKRDMEATRITYMLIEDDETEVDASILELKPIMNQNPVVSALRTFRTNRSRVNNQKPLTTPLISSVPAPAFVVNNSAGYQAAAKLLLSGLDLTVDPCQDFYAFTCNTFLKNATIPPGASRIGTYDQSQELVNSQIAANTGNINGASSLTEQMFLIGYQSCLQWFNNPNPADMSNKINSQLISQLGGLPMLTVNWPGMDWGNFWKTAGVYESSYGVGSLFSSYVSIDYGHKESHALYINQGNLMLPRDYYVKNEYLAEMDDYLNSLVSLVQLFNADIGGIVLDADIRTAVTETVEFEILLALAMVPDELLRNYHQQYNLYTLGQLKTAYPNINWDYYLQGALKDVDPMYQQDHYVVTQPAFFGALDSMIGGSRVTQRVLANFVGLRLLSYYSDFIGGDARALSRKIRQFQVNPRSKKPIRFYDEDKQYCVDFMSTYMPYGSGFIYVKNIPERDQVKTDVDRQTTLIIESFLNMTTTLKWIDAYSLNNVMVKNQNLVKNIGWPWWFSFSNTNYMDNIYHVYYKTLLSINQSDFFAINLALNLAYQQTENFGLLEKAADRENFGGPPSEVNAWYIPERNSITFPYAAFNPPYYRFDFPQAFNYAGQGGTAGHELTHGYDDEGVQFGPTGELSDCTWDRCGWMDKNSTLGFIQMAQCVVAQYNEKCCPLKTGNVHCANGANTQGENIADLGGQQAAYKAYRKYIQVDRNGIEEDRLPGLEQFSPNQIFWITYGYSWCMLQETDNLVNQLLTNPHAPGSCRVNQVMQDIPEWGMDFNCAVNTPMRPSEDQRCHVWTDAPL